MEFPVGTIELFYRVHAWAADTKGFTDDIGLSGGYFAKITMFLFYATLDFSIKICETIGNGVP